MMNEQNWCSPIIKSAQCKRQTKNEGWKHNKQRMWNSKLHQSPVQMLVSVEGNKSLPLIWSPAVLVGSISGLLSWCPFKPQHRVSYLGLISSVLPVKDPWPLLGSPLPVFLPWELALSNLLCFYFFMHLCWWQLDRDGDIGFTLFFLFTQF